MKTIISLLVLLLISCSEPSKVSYTDYRLTYNGIVTIDPKPKPDYINFDYIGNNNYTLYCKDRIPDVLKFILT